MKQQAFVLESEAEFNHVEDVYSSQGAWDNQRTIDPEPHEGRKIQQRCLKPIR